MAVPPYRRVDDWELRCRFNTAHLYERWLANEFRTEYGDPGDPSPESGQPSNTISQMLYYYDPKTNDEIAKVHYFQLDTGKIGGSGFHDPKGLFLNGVRYRQMKGPSVNRDPGMAFPEGKQRNAYGRFRRWCCRIFGPETDRAFASDPRIVRLGMWIMLRLSIFQSSRASP